MPDSVLPLSGQVALITGACGGIGRACATALARAGADIAANDIGVLTSEARGKSGAADIGPNDVRLSPAARSLAAHRPRLRLDSPRYFLFDQSKDPL